jgi:choice-of-anchor B domain-containing protein
MLRLLLAAILFLPLIVSAQSSWRISLMSRWDNDSLSSLASQSYNEIGGWYDEVKQKEYALLCSIDSIYFFEVSNPSQPVLCDVKAGRAAGCKNRDIKTYKHYAYAIAGQGVSSLQIFDLQYLPDSVHKVYDSDSFCLRAHALCIDSSSARLYLCNTERNVSGQPTSFAVTVLSLSNPERPAYLSDLIPPASTFSLVHDAFAWKDTLFCSTGGPGVYILEYSQADSPRIIKVLGSYPEKGFSHSVVFEPFHRLMAFSDENSGLAVKLADVKNFGSPVISDLLRSSLQAVAHKPYFDYPFVWVSAYHDGLYAFNISDPGNVKRAAWFDTYDNQGSYTGFKGCWGVYPYLPSGIILASDMSNGLFVLRPDSNLSMYETMDLPASVYPNPFINDFRVQVPGLKNGGCL